MNGSESYNTWLETAYRLFAEEGPENFSIKALAQKCGLPRTNFYYYFENKEEIIDKIIELHFTTTIETFNEELKKRLHTYVPDLFVILYDFKLGIQFAKQLFKNREIQKYNDAYKKGVALSADILIPKFKTFFEIDLSDGIVKTLWFTLVDTWYSRLNFNDFSVASQCTLHYEIIDSVLPLTRKTIITQNNSSNSFDAPV
ncbi:MAG: TetR/AcrR family transcriptional regulator [Cytophagales bacterium]|nr:TetR/AcrR family transcriptional regulator [Cytophagales bacterium]